MEGVCLPVHAIHLVDVLLMRTRGRESYSGDLQYYGGVLWVLREGPSDWLLSKAHYNTDSPAIYLCHIH